MEEFLAKEGVTGGLRGVLPPGNSSEAWGPKLWSYLNKVCVISYIIIKYFFAFLAFFVCFTILFFSCFCFVSSRFLSFFFLRLICLVQRKFHCQFFWFSHPLYLPISETLKWDTKNINHLALGCRWEARMARTSLRHARQARYVLQHFYVVR
jgi:hypothetical protein